MRWAYVGNFGPEHSTENHVRRSLVGLGHEVAALQENDHETWARLPAVAAEVDVVLWTRTWSLDHGVQLAAMKGVRGTGTPLVGFHLDRWWGLNREGQVREEPFFRVDLLATADGGHEQEWVAAGVNHVWMPPGVAESECEPAEPDARYISDVAFVGSWRPGYHEEWTHRPALIEFLRSTYPDACRFWPAHPHASIRGQELRRLYATVPILVGDSCLAGGATAYWSDRIPETLGRGGFLIHPYVEGIEEHFTDGEHLRLWPLGEWDELRRLIDYYRRPEHDRERRTIAAAGRAHVLANHTYAVRMRQLVDVLGERGML